MFDGMVCYDGMRNSTYKEAAVTGADALLTALGTTTEGLPEHAVEEVRRGCGANGITMRQITARDVFLRQVRSPFIYLLAGAAVVALSIGERVDAIIVAAFIFVNAFLGFYQEYRAEQAAKLLHRFWKNQARVLRNGDRTVVDSALLVPGDVIELRTGDKIPADVRFIASDNVVVDESLLTGEVEPVFKTADAMAAAPDEYHEASNIGFSGTTVTGGSGTAVVFATGERSSLGSIVQLTGSTSTVGTFERSISGFSGFIMKMIFVTLGAVFLINLWIKGPGELESLFLFSIALTVGVIPEALPAVMTIVHSRAAVQLAKRNVIVKRLSSIDDLGSIDVLCTDKTGTVTQNDLRVADVHADDTDSCMRIALLGSSLIGQEHPESDNPYDSAILDAAPAMTRIDAVQGRRIAENPFDAVRRVNTSLVETAGGERMIIMRGSPEEVLAHCDDVRDQLALGRHLEHQGHAGLRLLAIAHKTAVGKERIGKEDEHGLVFDGVISFEDPLKPDAVAAIEKAEQLGVRIVMLTGDAKEVAGAVAVKLGLTEDHGHVITGAEFEAATAERQVEMADSFDVFARVNPEQKFRILGLLKARGLSVGFMGEGVNDAPGLKMADVAIAVENASDIAKDAADVIILTKSLSVIIDGVEAGRRNFANITTYLNITLASNFGNFYAVAISSLLIPFLPLLAVQILLINLLTDTPMIAISQDRVNQGDLKRPSKYDVRTLIIIATIIGIVSSAFDFLTFALFRNSGEQTLQTMWFIESTLTELALIFSLRTGGLFFRGPRVPAAIGALVIVVAAVTIGLPYTEIGARLFSFIRPETPDLVLVFVIVATYFAATEAVKLWLRRTSLISARNP